MSVSTSILRSIRPISLADASVRKDKGMAHAKPFFTMVSSSKIMVGAIEEALKTRYDDNEAWQNISGGYNPRKCDAVYQDGESLTLIEFKSGSTDFTDLHRKLYDTVLALMEYDGFSVADCRKNVTYIVVLSNDNLKSNADRITDYVSEEAIARPWNLSAYRAVGNLSNLKWMLRDVLTLTPRQFDLYVRDREWKSFSEASPN